MAPALVHRLVGPPSLVDRPQGRRKAMAMAGRVLEPFDPALRLAGRDPVPPYVVLSVYRRRNAAALRRVLGPVRPDRVLLWALDEIDAELGPMTVGTGPGTRLGLVNRLAGHLQADDRWTVVVDDDVAVESGSLDRLVATAARAGLDLAQPAHSRWSHLNWEVTRHRTGSIARQTRFVDQGPVLVLSGRARRRLVPFTETEGMSWGVEALWANQADLRIGVVDRVTIRHLAPAGQAGYSVTQEWARANQLLARAGYTSWAQVQRELGRWRFPRRRPPWSPDVGAEQESGLSGRTIAGGRSHRDVIPARRPGRDVVPAGRSRQPPQSEQEGSRS